MAYVRQWQSYANQMVNKAWSSSASLFMVHFEVTNYCCHVQKYDINSKIIDKLVEKRSLTSHIRCQWNGQVICVHRTATSYRNYVCSLRRIAGQPRQTLSVDVAVITCAKSTNVHSAGCYVNRHRRAAYALGIWYDRLGPEKTPKERRGTNDFKQMFQFNQLQCLNLLFRTPFQPFLTHAKMRKNDSNTNNQCVAIT